LGSTKLISFLLLFCRPIRDEFSTKTKQDYSFVSVLSTVRNGLRRVKPKKHLQNTKLTVALLFLFLEFSYKGGPPQYQVPAWSTEQVTVGLIITTHYTITTHRPFGT
jgi:hypothetical protein